MAQFTPDFDQMASERDATFGGFMKVTKWVTILIALTLVIMAATLV